MKLPELPIDTLVAEAEAERVLQICNACRYCEGFCAVFPAMARRLEFPPADVHYLAHLCHHCGACLHACQYALPHAFAVDVPQALAAVRVKSWADHAWPQPLARLYRRNGLVLVIALVLAVTLFLALAAATQGTLWAAPAGGFYAVFPHTLMAAMFTPVFAFSLLALTVAVTRFWRGVPPGRASAAALREATHDALTLKYLGGGHGEGCNEEDDRWTLARRRLHHLAFYGFTLCFAATVVASLYHFVFGWPAPYAWSSLPKLLGVAGGLSLIVGSAGLGLLRWRRTLRHTPQQPMDLGFIALLFITAASGLALALARGSAAMPLLLCLHLGAVMAFFATLPYSKFVHGAYRAAALLKWAIERRQPSRLRLGGDL